MRSRTRDHEPGLPALWPGTCCICGMVFPKGARIVKKRGEPCHADCYMREHE